MKLTAILKENDQKEQPDEIKSLVPNDLDPKYYKRLKNRHSALKYQVERIYDEIVELIHNDDLIPYSLTSISNHTSIPNTIKIHFPNISPFIKFVYRDRLVLGTNPNKEAIVKRVQELIASAQALDDKLQEFQVKYKFSDD